MFIPGKSVLRYLFGGQLNSFEIPYQQILEIVKDRSRQYRFKITTRSGDEYKFGVGANKDHILGLIRTSLSHGEG